MVVATIARLTIRETQRRRIIWIGGVMSLAFLAIFALGFHFVYIDIIQTTTPEDFIYPFLFLTLAGVYATNFLVIMVAVLISVATICKLSVRSNEADTEDTIRFTKASSWLR